MTDVAPEQILDELRAASSREEVEEVADRHRDQVMRMKGDPETEVRAIHIINLKAHRLRLLENDEGSA